MKKRVITLLLMMALIIGLVPTSVSGAKTIKKIKNGGYHTEFTSAKIKNGYLIVKGKVTNWARATDTPDYSKKGTFKFKLTKKCEIIDGQNEDEVTLTASKFNKLCKEKDELHQAIAFMVKGNKVSLIRFW